MPFVNSYRFQGPSVFRTIVPASDSDKSGSAAGHLAIGVEINSGLATRIGSDGAVVWSRRYNLDGRPLDFIDGVAASKGFALLSMAEMPETTGIQRYIVVRIDAAGDVLWAREVYSGQTLSAARLLCIGGRAEEFLLFGRTISAQHSIELIRLAADGSLIRAAQMQTKSDDAVFDAVAFNDGFILVGVSVRPQGRAGLVVYVDGGLNLRSAWLIGGTQKESISLRSVAVLSPDSFVVAGQWSPDGRVQSSLVAEIRVGSGAIFNVARAFAYGVNDGQDQPGKIAVFGSDFLVLDVPDIIKRPQTILRIDGNMAPKALYGFGFDDGTKLSTVRVGGKNSVLIPGTVASPPPSGDALLLDLDDTFACCKTKFLQKPPSQPLKLTISRLDANVADMRGRSTEGKVYAIKDDPTVKPLCNTAVIDLLKDRLVQSPYLNLQASGSLGSDASRGILLRWSLAGIVGETHLPKGTLAQSTVNFNKPDDFVTIYRAVWPNSGVPARRLSFASDKPVYVDNTVQTLVFETGTVTPRDLFVVRFLNPAAYATAASTANPTQNPAGFLSAYGANPIEIELRNVLAVACDLEFQPNAASVLRVETLSVDENRPLAPKHVTSRRVLGAANGPIARLFAENIRSVRLACSGTQISSVSFIGYDDVLTHVNQGTGWDPVGKFALTLDQPTVFQRLEDTAHFQVNGLWRKFNDGAFVNVNNYKSRWLNSPDGISAAVQRYVQLSNSDPMANAQIGGTLQEDGSISVSYLNLLTMAALVDYHMARMLGLGHVDAAGIDQSAPYIHVAEYKTLGDLADGKGARPVQHLYMSLPTNLGLARLPLVPDFDPIEYGLTVPTGSGGLVSLTNQEGYTPDGLARYIRIYPECEPLYEEERGFFIPPVPFDLAASSLPVLYGVEYRKQAESGWRKPEIAHDPDYSDTATPPIAEPVPTPFPASRRASAYIHKETEPGIHEYALYSINLFSRASPLSPTRATDETKFRRPNRLLPPSDLQVQLIQKESPLVLTTNAEQSMLTGLLQLPGDPTLVRLSFNYAHAQDANYDFADTVEIFFRQQLPANVVGGIKGIGSGADPSLARIETQPYTFVSTQETVAPVIPAGQKPNFLGGVLVAGGQRFPIEDIDWLDPLTGEDPIFVIRKPTTTGVVNAGGSNTLVVEDVALQLNQGDLIMAVENMAAASSWGSSAPLSTTITIGAPNWTPTVESFVRSDGTQVSRRLRGIWKHAQIDQNPISVIPDEPKYYDITFAGFNLSPHPQSNAADPVNWYKGIVRVSVAGNDPEDRRALTVLQVGQTTGGDLQLRAVDDSGDTNLVVTGAGKLVNYYPGYKVYLHADPARGFGAGTIMPGQGEGTKTTLIGLRSADNTTIDASGQLYLYRSSLGVPQILTAVEILEPKVPQTPMGLKYATPPDTFDKSSFTLTVNFASQHKPFAAVFYRADAFNILRTIYKPETFDRVRADMFPPERDLFFTNRFVDLFAFLSPGNTATTRPTYPLNNSSSDMLPEPDAEGLDLATAPTLADRKARIRTALLNAFLPLTEQPLIYDLIRPDPTYVPTNMKQTYRDSNGDLLTPGVAPFDLAPMAKRFESGGNHSIQFTDFTLDGSMNPNTIYFYCVRELGNRMQLGDASPIFGPVKLVNLSPPSAPKVRKIVTVPYDVLTSHNPEVRFEVVLPSSTDPVTRMRIYRATSALDALTLRTMTMVREIDLATLATTPDETLIGTDDFSTSPFVPYGENLFYRLVWIRDVTYEDSNGAPQSAAAISEPTQTLLANLIDIVNPAAPVPTLHLVSITSAGEKFLRMNWSKTVHNGTYYVSRLAPSGNWIRLASIKKNDALVTYDLLNPLPVDDEDGNMIYYRFKIDVENSSGLLNLVDVPVTVSLDSILA